MNISNLLRHGLCCFVLWSFIAPAWTQTVDLSDLSFFEPAEKNWRIAGSATADPGAAEAMKAGKGTGVLVNLPSDKHRGNLVSRMEHGDLDLELEFMMARHSNSGIYLQGRYELQLLDSWGKDRVSYGDCGGIYQRWDEGRPAGAKGYQGYAPRLNACRAPGLWQQLSISFRAPRFDRYGNKTANARILEVRLNGVTIHENVELTGPTRGGRTPEAPLGPLLIQGDHGPVAFRNIRYRVYNQPPLQVPAWTYAVYEAEGSAFPALQGRAPVAEGRSEQLTHEVVNRDARFALQLQGAVTIREAGAYTFDLATRGFGRLEVDGREVIAPAWNGGSGTVDLAPGRHRLRITYYKPDSWYPTGLGLFVAGPGIRRHPLHVESSIPLSNLPAPIFVSYGAEPVLLRSFVDVRNPDDSVAHRITHAISVGFPEDAAYAYNLKNGALFRIWRGGFLDATPMWNNRGDGSARPLGSALTLGDYPALAPLESGTAPWPATAAEVRPRGYRLDADGVPTYHYEVAGTAVEDRIDAADDGRRLQRTLRFPDGAGSNLYLRLAAGNAIDALPNNRYAVDREYYIVLPEKSKVEPQLRRRDGRQELLLPVGAHSEVRYNIEW